jgi:hypothetical protein
MDDGGFWASFVDDAWERRSARYGAGESAALPQIEADELFEAVRACTDEFVRNGRQRVRFYVEDGLEVDLVGGKHLDLLPARGDDGFEAYDERLKRLGLGEYGLVVADWHQFDRALWERIVVSLDGLVARVGVSRSRMDTQVFLGTYASTPFGVHVDATSGFHFPVVGSKSMRFWTDEYVSQHPALQRARQYDAFLDASEVVTAPPGEVIYWPSNYWHVAESDGSFSVTWGCGYWLGDGMASMALEELAAELRASPLETASVCSADLPKSARELDVVGSLLGAVSGITRAWLEHHSGFGFLRLPPPVDAEEVGPSTVVRRKAPLPILLAPLTADGEMVCVASAGRSHCMLARPSLEAAVEQLNAGEPLSLADGFTDDEVESLRELMTFGLWTGGLVAEAPAAR